jgi:acyl-CoA synthetase (AMP-forming)/AMP-acid ligase II
MGLHPPERVAEYTANGWWSDETVDGLLRDRAAVHPDRLAVVDPANCLDLTGRAPQRWTWRELDAQADRFAAVLLAHGVRQGDVVAVQLPNGVEIVQVFLAAIRIGAVLTPLPVQYREYEIGKLCERVDPKVFVTSTRIGDRENALSVRDLRVSPVLAWGPEVPDGVVDIDTVETAPDEPAAYLSGLTVDPNDPVTICWTSGTEATPKGVPRCHYDWLAITWGTYDAMEIGEGDVLLNPFPMTNMAGIGGMFLVWLRSGCTFVQHHPFDLQVYLRQIAEERVTHTIAPPAILTMLLQRGEILEQTDISSLRMVGSGSAPLPPFMVRGWQEKYGVSILNFFGSNEGTSLLSAPAAMPDPDDRARYFPRYGAEGVEWHSRLAKWVSVKLVDPATGAEALKPGEGGELHIKGPTIIDHYLDGPALDEDGWFHTGDLFEVAGENGQFLRYVDRSKDIVVRGGMNIAPAELEALLSGHPELAEVAVVGYPDAVMGEKVCAVVVPKPGSTVTLTDLTAYLRDRHIASFKLPERLEIVGSLPRNPVGKVLKREIRKTL